MIGRHSRSVDPARTPAGPGYRREDSSRGGMGPVRYATVATFLRPPGRIVTARSTNTRRIL